METENDTMPRVCISTSIENCLNGILYLRNYRKFVSRDLQFNFDICPEDCFRLFKVYEFDLDSGINIKNPEYIYENGFVEDALSNNEYWSLDTIKPTKSYIIQIIGEPKIIKVQSEKDFSFSEQLREVKYKIIKTNDIPEYVDIKFKEVNDEVLELFDEYSDSSIVYQIKDVYADKVKVSTNLYPAITKNLEFIIDEYFKYCPGYIGVET